MFPIKYGSSSLDGSMWKLKGVRVPCERSKWFWPITDIYSVSGTEVCTHWEGVGIDVRDIFYNATNLYIHPVTIMCIYVRTYVYTYIHSNPYIQILTCRPWYLVSWRAIMEKSQKHLRFYLKRCSYKLYNHIYCNGVYSIWVTYFCLYLTMDATHNVLCLILLVARWFNITWFGMGRAPDVLSVCAFE